MKAILIAAAVALLLAGGGPLRADAPGLLEGVMIEDGGSPLSVAKASSVTTVDWNSDGKKDLIVGEGDGYVWFFANTGTDVDPVFNGGVKLYSGGQPILADYASG